MFLELIRSTLELVRQCDILRARQSNIYDTLFVLGVQNASGVPLTTDVWWDELRLLDPNNKPDYALNAQTQLKLAEFGKLSASIVNERADFVRVDERFNQTRSLNFGWNVTGEFGMEKILQSVWRINRIFHLRFRILRQFLHRSTCRIPMSIFKELSTKLLSV